MYAEPYYHDPSEDEWRMADNFTMKCGCIIAILIVDGGDYGRDGWVDYKEVSATKMEQPCKEHGGK